MKTKQFSFYLLKKKLKLPNLFLEVEKPKSSQFNHSFHSQVIWNTPWQSLQLLYTLHNTCLDSEKGVHQDKAPVDQNVDCTICLINQLIIKHYCQCFTRRRKNNTDVSKPVACHFNIPNHSHHNMTICGLSFHHGNTESPKSLEQKFIFQLGTLSHTELMNTSHSTNLFTNSCDHISTNGKVPVCSHINHNTPQFLYSL